MTIQDFAKMREWILRGNSCFVYISECSLLMWLLRHSKVPCEYMHYDQETCVIFPHVGL